MADAPVFDPDRPGPGEATSAADFVAAMRRLKSWSGLSYRRLERNARIAGELLPRTTLTTALTHDRLPTEELVAAFARACGCTPAEIDHWIRTRRRIAAHEPRPAEANGRRAPVAVPESEGAAPAPSGQPGPSPMANVPAAGHPSAQETRVPVYVPVILGRARRRVLLAFAVATAVGTAAGVLGVEALKSSAGEPAQAAPASSTPNAAAASPLGAKPVPSATGPYESVAAGMAEAPPPTERDMRRPPAAKPGVPAMLYVGDSIGVETQNVVKYFVHRTGMARVVADVRNGAPICDFLSGRARPGAALGQLVARVKPRVVALQFWSGTAGCAGGKADVRAAVKEITNAAERAGIKRPRLVWVLQGPDKDDRERVRTLNDVYQAVADDHDDLAADAGAEVSMAAYFYEQVPDGRYKYTGSLPCTELERRYPEYCMSVAFGGVTHMHAKDGEEYFCYEVTPDHRCRVISPGVVRYSRVIAQTMVKALA